MSAKEQRHSTVTEDALRIDECRCALEQVQAARAAVIALHTTGDDDPALREAHWYMTRAYDFMTNYVKSLEREVAGL